MGWKKWAAYAANPAMALGAESLGLGIDGALGGTDRFGQAGQYGGMDESNFQMPGIGSAGQGGGGVNTGNHWFDNAANQMGGGGGGKSGYDQFQDRYTDYLGDVRDRGAPQIGDFQNAQGSAVAGQQQGLADMLGARARGENSVAEQQLRQAAGMGMSQQAALAAGARPGNAAMAGRMAGQNMGRLQSGLGGQAAIARMQEANMAQGQLGNLYGQMRGADENMSMFNAGQQNNRTGMQAQMDQNQMGMNDQANQNLLGQSLGAAQSQQQAGIAQEQIAANRWGAALGVPTQTEMVLGGVAAAAPAAIAASDERVKTNIQPGGQAADAFLDSVTARPEELSRERPMKPMLKKGKRVIVQEPLVIDGDVPPPPDPTMARPEELYRERVPVRPAELSRERRALPAAAGAARGATLGASDQFLDGLDPQSYNYKPGTPHAGALGGGQPTMGVMAQDVAKAGPLGADAVGQTDEGMYFLDPRRMSSALAAGMGRLNERLAALETNKRS